MYQISLDFIYNVQFQEMICPIIPPSPPAEGNGISWG